MYPICLKTGKQTLKQRNACLYCVLLRLQRTELVRSTCSHTSTRCMCVFVCVEGGRQRTQYESVGVRRPSCSTLCNDAANKRRNFKQREAGMFVYVISAGRGNRWLNIHASLGRAPSFSLCARPGFCHWKSHTERKPLAADIVSVSPCCRRRRRRWRSTPASAVSTRI